MSSPTQICMEENTQVTMKQYTNGQQTAKLIELGFEKPINTVVKEEPIYREGSIIDWKPIAEEGSYSIGELIEFCPRVIGRIGQDYVTIEISHDTVHWIVGYTDFDDRLTYATSNSELIDAIFDMLIKLKEKELI